MSKTKNKKLKNDGTKKQEVPTTASQQNQGIPDIDIKKLMGCGG